MAVNGMFSVVLRHLNPIDFLIALSSASSPPFVWFRYFLGSAFGICPVNLPAVNVLENPVYHSLLTLDRALGTGTGRVRFFDEAVSPFAGFETGYQRGFADLYEQLPPARVILCATTENLSTPKGWKLLASVEGIQMIAGDLQKQGSTKAAVQPVQLKEKHVPQMMELAKLTKPGPFGPRTIAFGQYHGIFDDGMLVAMTGQRLHLEGHTEISAVCTHPEHTGKGYAYLLVQQQMDIIYQQGQIPFLHVRKDNVRAIAVYERLGFALSRAMNFYFLRRLKDDENIAEK